MALVLADLGAGAILRCYFNNTRPGGGSNLTLRLFTNDIDPLDTHIISSFTEALGGGYVTKTLTLGNWVVDTSHTPCDAVYNSQISWTFTGPLTTNPTIYGYFITDATPTLVWAERVATPFTPLINGDKLLITPRLQLSKGTPT